MQSLQRQGSGKEGDRLRPDQNPNEAKFPAASIANMVVLIRRHGGADYQNCDQESFAVMSTSLLQMSCVKINSAIIAPLADAYLTERYCTHKLLTRWGRKPRSRGALIKMTSRSRVPKRNWRNRSRMRCLGIQQASCSAVQKSGARQGDC